MSALLARNRRHDDVDSGRDCQHNWFKVKKKRGGVADICLFLYMGTIFKFQLLTQKNGKNALN